jgi:hypothetical protein
VNLSIKRILTSIFRRLNGTITEKKPRTQDPNAPQCYYICTGTLPVLFTSDLLSFFFINHLLPATTLSSNGNVVDGGVSTYWVDTVRSATQDGDTERLVVVFRHCFANASNKSGHETGQMLYNSRFFNHSTHHCTPLAWILTTGRSWTPASARV